MYTLSDYVAADFGSDSQENRIWIRIRPSKKPDPDPTRTKIRILKHRIRIQPIFLFQYLTLKLFEKSYFF